MTRYGTRVAAATVAMGLSLAGPQALGLAVADTGEADGASVSAGAAQDGPSRAGRSARESRAGQVASRAGASNSQGRGGSTTRQAVPPGAAEAAEAQDDPAEVLTDHEVVVADTDGGDADGAEAGADESPIARDDSAGAVDDSTDPVRDIVEHHRDIPGAVGVPFPRWDYGAPLPWWRGGTGDSVTDLPGDVDDLVWAYNTAPDEEATPGPVAGIASVFDQAIAGVRAAVAGFFDTLSQLVSGLPGGPFADFLSGALLLVRRAILGTENVLSSAAVEPPAVTAADPNQHVLLIGVDGTNLSAILADPYNQAFFDLMDTGTTAAATMVGHTTISNPSWTGILTGVWSETAGVSNNVFTPWTYDTWPTVFNQLETLDPSIATTSIGNWEVIAQIAGAGSVPADTIVFYPQINGSWLETDDAVGARSVEAIQNTVPGAPSFQMTYFVGVDDTGHDTYGAGSPEYAAALRNVNDNIADIMAAVDAWEAANPGEQWTVIAVTDHGQVLDAPLSPLLAGLLAHGFQSPLETSVWVIADGPDFADGYVNNTYSQVDITPTVLRLFGFDPEPYSEGVPLMDKFASDYLPAIPGQAALKNALGDALDMYGYPDVMTDLVLAIRTLVATVPYFVYTAVEGITAGLPEFLALPIKFLGAIIYQLVNIPAQLIVRATGVTGNQIIPPQLWPYNPVPGTQPVPPTASVPAAAVAV